MVPCLPECYFSQLYKQVFVCLLKRNAVKTHKPTTEKKVSFEMLPQTSLIWRQWCNWCYFVRKIKQLKFMTNELEYHVLGFYVVSQDFLCPKIIWCYRRASFEKPFLYHQQQCSRNAYPKLGIALHWGYLKIS